VTPFLLENIGNHNIWKKRNTPIRQAIHRWEVEVVHGYSTTTYAWMFIRR